MQELIEVISQVAEKVPRITYEILAVMQDPKGDYLLA